MVHLMQPSGANAQQEGITGSPDPCLLASQPAASSPALPYGDLSVDYLLF